MKDPALSLLTGSLPLFLSWCEAQVRLDLAKHLRFAEHVHQNSRLIIFGAGERGLSLAVLLKHTGYTGEVCFCDNNKDLVGKLCNGFYVYAPHNALRGDDGAAFVLPTPALEHVMREQLLNLGVKPEQILSAPNVWPLEMVAMRRGDFNLEVDA